MCEAVLDKPAMISLGDGNKKTVIVQIAEEDFKFLKQGDGYKMCFAKKVNDKFNVVWKSVDKKHYYENTTFNWESKYQIFCTDIYEANVKVTTNTEVRDVILGEKVILDKAGVLSQAKTGIPDWITLEDKFGQTHPGLGMRSIDGSFVPIFVDPDGIVKGEAKYLPKEEVMVWFEKQIETSTIFVDERSMSTVVDLTSIDSATLRYEDGEWKKI